MKYALALAVTIAPATLVPPPEFDHPFEGDLFIADELTMDQMREMCRLPNAPIVLGCTQPHPQMLEPTTRPTCVILLAKKALIELNRYTVEQIIRHETGHCNGWLHL